MKKKMKRKEEEEEERGRRIRRKETLWSPHFFLSFFLPRISFSLLFISFFLSFFLPRISFSFLFFSFFIIHPFIYSFLPHRVHVPVQPAAVPDAQVRGRARVRI